MSNIITVGSGPRMASIIEALKECGLNAIEATAAINGFKCAIGDYKLESKSVSKKKWTDRNKRWC